MNEFEILKKRIGAIPLSQRAQHRIIRDVLRGIVEILEERYGTKETDKAEPKNEAIIKALEPKKERKN